MRPWHFYPVILFALLWQGVAALDYLAFVLRIPVYLALFPADVVDFFTGLPFRIHAVWAVGVWSGLAGVLMILWGMRGATVVLAVSAAAMVFLALWLVVLAWPPLRSVAGFAGDALLVGSALMPVLFWFYAGTQRVRGAVR